MEINRLSQDELSYELKVRGLPVGKVEEMRVSFRQALRAEKEGQLLVSDPYPYTFAEDTEELNKKVEEIRELINIFEGDSLSSDYKKIWAKIEWALRRVGRAKPEGGDQKKQLSQIRANLVLSLGAVKIKADGEYEEDDSSDEIGDLSMTAKVVTNAHARIPLHKWDVKFSGDPGQSLNSFLERVNELSEARGINRYQLFRSALDLFSGKALLWYRANKANFHSWIDLVKELKREFLPYDYDDRLLDEIRRRTQGSGETMGMYIAVMKNMFTRLSEPLTEVQQLRILKRNISPFYQTQLGLTEVETIQDLLDLGRRLEAIRSSVEAYAPPPSRRNNQLLEPDLAYIYSEHTIATITNRNLEPNSVVSPRVRCFKCRCFGHIARFCQNELRCYGCGALGVTRNRCTNCTSQSQRQHQQTGSPRERTRPPQVEERNLGQPRSTLTGSSGNHPSGNANRAQ